MATRETFLSPDGDVISREQRDKFMSCNGYLLRLFKNSKLSIRLIAIDRIKIDKEVPKEHWTLFNLEVKI